MRTTTKIFLLVLSIGAILILLPFILSTIMFLSYPPNSPSQNLITDYEEINFSTNKNFEFKVGEKFIYRNIKYVIAIKEDKTKETRIYNIGHESYSIVGETDDGFITLNERNVTTQTDFMVTGIFKRTYSINSTYLCSKDGNVSLKDAKTNINFDENFFINKWMLGLEENKTFEIKFSIGNTTEIKEFTALGKENINGRECYKVKMLTYSLQSPNYKHLYYYWIDTEKRILVKMEKYDDIGKQLEINLIE